MRQFNLLYCIELLQFFYDLSKGHKITTNHELDDECLQHDGGRGRDECLPHTEGLGPDEGLQHGGGHGMDQDMAHVHLPTVARGLLPIVRIGTFSASVPPYPS